MKLIFRSKPISHLNLKLYTRKFSLKMSTPKITLYTAGTPNGYKASIALELLKLPFEVKALSFAKNEQKEEWFLKINPNGRIPAMVDHSNGDFAVFESGAILLYLAEHYDKDHVLLPEDPKLRSEAIQWLMFQMGGVGPMMGQANHFFRYAPEKIPYGIKRYQDETKRLISVIESRLVGKKYLVGERITVAEVSLFPWVFLAPWAGVDLNAFPNVKTWVDGLDKHEDFYKGMDCPEPNKMRELLSDPELAEKAAKEASEWIMKGQQK